MKINVKIFVPKYDLQGDEVEVETEDFGSVDDWERQKQTLIDDFINSRGFNESFKKKYKGDFQDFGKGTYVDNKSNRIKNRVGKSYDKGRGLREEIEKAVTSRSLIIEGEESVTSNIRPKPTRQVAVRRPWTQREVEFVRTNPKLTYAQIGMRLFRTQSSVSHKARRAGIRRRR